MYNSLFIDELLKTKDIDILAIQEHKLFKHNQDFLNVINNDYTSVTMCSANLEPYAWNSYGKGGVSLLFKKSLLKCVEPLTLDVNYDRLCGIRLKLDSNNSVYIFSVYMPCSKEPRASYLAWCEIIQNIYHEYEELGSVIVMGDLNAEIKGRDVPSPNLQTLPYWQS